MTVSIIAIVATVSGGIFKNMQTHSAMRAGGSEVYSALIDARTKTLASQGGTVYGVHISTSTVTRFQGPVYTFGSTTNQIYSFESGVTATSSLITNGGNIIFQRLTGESSASGMLYIRDAERTSTTTIVVSTSGLVEYR